MPIDKNGLERGCGCWMSLDEQPSIVWTAGPGGAVSRSRNTGAFTPSSPLEFRLNLIAANNPAASNMEAGLRFTNAAATRTSGGVIGGGTLHAHKQLLESGVGPGLSVSKGVGRLMLASQIMIVLTLAILIFTLLFMSWRLNYNVSYYYAAASPYLSEFSNHSMGIMRHADASTASLEEVMTQTQVLAGTSIPELMDSVNKTATMVARLQEVAQNPVIKLSMG